MTRVCKLHGERHRYGFYLFFVSRVLVGAWTFWRAILNARGIDAVSFPKAVSKWTDFAHYGMTVAIGCGLIVQLSIFWKKLKISGRLCLSQPGCQHVAPCESNRCLNSDENVWERILLRYAAKKRVPGLCAWMAKHKKRSMLSRIRANLIHIFCQSDDSVRQKVFQLSCTIYEPCHVPNEKLRGMPDELTFQNAFCLVLLAQARIE